MKKDILEIYLNKNVIILLSDYIIQSSVLYKVEDYAKRDIFLKIIILLKIKQIFLKSYII